MVVNFPFPWTHNPGEESTFLCKRVAQGDLLLAQCYSQGPCYHSTYVRMYCRQIQGSVVRVTSSKWWPWPTCSRKKTT